MAAPGDLCAYCRMPRSMHCPGRVWHSDEKGAGGHTCVSRHCLAPLCDCIEFKEPSKDDDHGPA